MQFCAALEPGGSAEEAPRLYPELLADLYAVRFHMEKLAAQGGAFEAEQQLYETKQAQLRASIAQVRFGVLWLVVSASQHAAWVLLQCMHVGGLARLLPALSVLFAPAPSSSSCLPSAPLLHRPRRLSRTSRTERWSWGRRGWSWRSSRSTRRSRSRSCRWAGMV